MKTLTAIALTTASFVALCAQSQVVIYKNKVTLTHTGAGSTSKVKIAGYSVLDATNGTVVRLEAYPATKTFREVQLAYSVNVVRGTGGKGYTVLALATSNTDTNGSTFVDSETLKGINVVTDIGDFSLTDWSIPKTMQVLGRTVYSSPAPSIDEATGTLSYDKSNTTEVNSLKKTISETVGALKQLLLDDGYSPSP